MSSLPKISGFDDLIDQETRDVALWCRPLAYS